MGGFQGQNYNNQYLYLFLLLLSSISLLFNIYIKLTCSQVEDYFSEYWNNRRKDITSPPWHMEHITHNVVYKNSVTILQLFLRGNLPQVIQGRN